jgi:hypothetical protein
MYPLLRSAPRRKAWQKRRRMSGVTTFFSILIFNYILKNKLDQNLFFTV